MRLKDEGVIGAGPINFFAFVLFFSLQFKKKYVIMVLRLREGAYMAFPGAPPPGDAVSPILV